MTEKKREALFPVICEKAVAYAIASVDEKEIDATDILSARMKAMQLAIDALQIPADYALIDGNRDHGASAKITTPPETIVGGDGASLSIAAASVLAKVSRDHYVVEVLDPMYPEYQFARHKGYGTKLHYQMLAAVIGVIVGAGLIGRAGTAGRLDDQRGIVDGRDGKLHLVLRHRNISRGRRLLCGGDIQNIAENDRLAGDQLEVRIHEFAERVGCPVVGVAQLLHRLRPAGAENRGAGGSRLFRRLNRSQTDHEGDAGLRHDRGADAASLLRDIYPEDQ